jgi:uncharacterized protein YjiS (DUF1127 family)
MNPMTNISIAHPARHGLGRRLLNWLPRVRRRHASASDIDTLSDRMLRDIGLSDAPELPEIRSLHDAMRYSS